MTMKRATKRMARIWTIEHPTADRPFKARGDCPAWAADFKGSATERAGAKITARMVAVGGAPDKGPCSYCVGMGRPVDHFTLV